MGFTSAFKGLIMLVAEFYLCQLVCSDCSKLSCRHDCASKSSVRNFRSMYTVFTEEFIVPYVDGVFHFKFGITLSSHLIVTQATV